MAKAQDGRLERLPTPLFAERSKWTSEGKRARSNGCICRRPPDEPNRPVRHPTRFCSFAAPMCPERLRPRGPVSAGHMGDDGAGVLLRNDAAGEPRRTPAMPWVHGRRATATNVKRCRTRSCSRRSRSGSAPRHPSRPDPLPLIVQGGSTGGCRWPFCSLCDSGSAGPWLGRLQVSGGSRREQA
jgi:hypothetical protein